MRVDFECLQSTRIPNHPYRILFSPVIAVTLAAPACFQRVHSLHKRNRTFSISQTHSSHFYRRSVLPPAGYVMEDCMHRCPELDACINSSLWCDGVSHCPSGFDEAAKHCSFILQLPLLYLALGAAGILVICCSLCLISCSACRRRRRSKLHRRIKSLPDAASLGKEVIC